MEKIKHISRINLDELPAASITRYWLELTTDTLGNEVCIPVIIAKGAEKGPVLGLTAAVHGNEVNGIPVIQRVISSINPALLTGILIGVPVVNVPALTDKVREFNDGKDLNHVFPGKTKGNESEVYAYRFFHSVVSHL